MCGICGIALTEQPAEAKPMVQRMAAAMRHRGPDDEGFLVDEPRAPGLALGMRRLSIIDLRTGHQPIWNETRDVAVILNGEIYNYRELRERLARSGHRFSTEADTEVLAHAWEEWGEDCLEELRGMFAFALLDLRKRYALTPLLFLARDPLGIKPLYYAQTAKAFAFASEVRALLAGGVAQRVISQDALTSYLLFGSVSEPVTILEGVFSLPPGHRMLVYVPERRRVPRARAWWDSTRSTEAKEGGATPGVNAAVQGVRARLEDAVRAHLIADVPVGLFLSSGLDSGAIAALAARIRPGICSFTLSFPGTPNDETELARAVARQCATQHREIPLQGSAVVSRIPEALSALDQPTMDGINTYFVSWAAREAGLKVALSGVGGDELFGGYSTFDDTRLIRRLIRAAWLMPAPLRTASAPLLRAMISKRRSLDGARKAVAAWMRPDALPHPYFFTRALFPVGNELSKLVEPSFRPSTVGADGVTLEPTWVGWLERSSDGARRLESMSAVSWLEMRCYMASTLLRDTDSVSMARSLEVRPPLLDTPLVEYVSGLPPAVRRGGVRAKQLLIDAVKDIVPEQIVAQRKRTFTLPWEDWLRGPLKHRVEEGLRQTPRPLSSLLRSTGVTEVWNDFLEGKTSWSRPWSIYVLNEWCRENLS